MATTVPLPMQLQRLVHAPGFQHVVIGTILASALVTGLETLPGTQRGIWLGALVMVEYLILAIFTLEQIARTGAHWPKPWEYFRSGWSVFDFVLVVLCFLPAAQFLSVLRIVRIARILRLIHPLHESDLLRQKNEELEAAYHALEREKERSENLLLNILPALIADRLKKEEKIIADHVEDATVLFADIVGFTDMSRQTTPEEVVSLLNDIFTRFDALTERNGLEKIKTIGDAYMVVAGVPLARADHADAVARMALELIDAVQDFNLEHGKQINVRVGFHSGPVVAGVIGRKKFTFDLWGDTVNTASRMESHGEPGRIQTTRTTHDRLCERFDFEAHGEVKIKGKGMMETYFLLGVKRPL